MTHVPVLLQETIQYLDPQRGDFVIDGTVGAGGHARELLARIREDGTLLGLDLDRSHIEFLRNEFAGYRSAKFLQGNYADLPALLEKNGLGKANCLLLDLGFSSFHVDVSGRGFSFMKNEPLLMTYDDSAVPVRDLLKKMREEEIARILKEYGEERFATRIAKEIYSRERRAPITTSGELANAVVAAMPRGMRKNRGIHPATRTFQAFRIYANHELENLTLVLQRLPDILVSGGRIAIISFHSIEDRIAKYALRTLEQHSVLHIMTKKPITPTREEIKNNPRSRSAKLRAAKML